MTNNARSQFLKVIQYYGNDIYQDPLKFKSLLNDYFKGQYKSERNVLVGSISAGVPERLLKSQGSIAYPTLRSQCIDLIQQEGFESKLAQWAVDSWAIGFKIIERTDTDEITGRMSITSTPAGGKVYLDDKLQGKSFLNLSAVPAGTHTLKCTLDGYQNWEQTIEVNPGELTNVIVTLTPKPVQPPKPNFPTPAPATFSQSPQPSPITPPERRGRGVTIAGILILAMCVIGGLYFLPHTNPQISNPPQQGTTAPFTIPVEDIRFDPIDDKYVGDKFTITAATNLTVGEEVIFEINPSSLKPTQKYSGFSGTAGIGKITKIDAVGRNILAFDVDASILAPKEYIIKATSVNQAETGTTRFNVLEGRPPTGHLSPVKTIITASSTPTKQFFPVTITAKYFESPYYRGETIHFSGANTDSNTIYLFILGPNLPENGARFTLTPKNDPVKNDDPLTFTQVPVKTVDRTWSYDWDMNSVAIDPGIYTIYAVSAPRDKTHLSGVTCRALPIIIKRPFIYGTVRKSTVTKGDSAFIIGIAEGKPSAGVAVWIFGNNYFTRAIAPIQSDATFKFEINGATTNSMATGDYYVVIQHPDNNQFDIDYNANTGQVFNRQTGAALFSLKGPNSLQSSAAADALVQGIKDDPNIDDDVTTVKFSIKL